MRTLPLLGLLWLTACGDPDAIPQDAFPTVAGQVICERTRECARGVFDRDYFGMKDCVRHEAQGLAVIDEIFEDLGCDYDEQGAAIAVRNAGQMSCEDFYEGRHLEDYDRVWDCR